MHGHRQAVWGFSAPAGRRFGCLPLFSWCSCCIPSQLLGTVPKTASRTGSRSRPHATLTSSGCNADQGNSVADQTRPSQLGMCFGRRAAERADMERKGQSGRLVAACGGHFGPCGCLPSLATSGPRLCGTRTRPALSALGTWRLAMHLHRMAPVISDARNRKGPVQGNSRASHFVGCGGTCRGADRERLGGVAERGVERERRQQDERPRTFHSERRAGCDQ